MAVGAGNRADIAAVWFVSMILIIFNHIEGTSCIAAESVGFMETAV